MEKWVDQTDLPEEFNLETMYITYQTGDGSDHLVPVIFTRETVKDMQYLTNNEVRKIQVFTKIIPTFFRVPTTVKVTPVGGTVSVISLKGYL